MLHKNGIKDIFKNSIFKNFSWMFISRFINMIGGFSISVLAARFFGVEEYGAYNYAIAFVAVFAPLYTWGIESYAIKEFAQNKDDINVTYGTIFYSLTFWAFIVTLIIFCFSGILDISYDKRAYIWITLIPNLMTSLLTARYYLEGMKRVKLLSIFQIIHQLLFIFLKVIVLLLYRSAFTFLIICSVESVLLSIIYILVMRIEKFYVNSVYSKEKLFYIFKICAPLLLSSFTVSIYMKIDQLMVGSMLGDSDLGIYSIAVKLSEIWYIVPATVYTAFLPVLSNDMNKNINEFWKKLQGFADILGGVSYMAIAFIMSFGTKMIIFAYGSEYSEAGSVIKIYIIGGLAVGIGYVLSAYVNINEHSMFSFIDTLIGCILNILLNTILIPRYGVYGAAIATVVACYSGAFLVCFCYGIVNQNYKKVLLCQAKALFPFYRLIKRLV